jgi:hypothetical protein
LYTLSGLARLDSFLLTQVYEPVEGCSHGHLGYAPYQSTGRLAWNIIGPLMFAECVELLPCVQIGSLEPTEIFLRLVDRYWLPFINHQFSKLALLKIPRLKNVFCWFS